MLEKQLFINTFMKKLAGENAQLNTALTKVFTKILTNQVTVNTETGQVTYSTAFEKLAQVFTFIATPSVDRITKGPIYKPTTVKAAVEAANKTITPTEIEPSYTLTASAASVDEGSSVTFTVKASDLPAGTTSLAYNLSGIQLEDLEQADLTGYFILDKQGVGSVTLNLAEDKLTEGPETLTLTLQDALQESSQDNTQTKISVLVNDTSLTPLITAYNPPTTGKGDVVSSYELQQQFPSGYDSDYNYTQDYRIDALLVGTMWGYGSGQGVELTYSFPTGGSLWAKNYGRGEPFNNFLNFNELQKAGARAALAQWSEVANIKFTEVEETPDMVGDLRFAFSGDVTGNTLGWAYIPNIDEYNYSEDTMISHTVSAESGDVWFNRANYNDKDWLAGSNNYHTLVHELGHSLGLKHPFDKEDSNGTLLTGSEDSYQYSVMSYTGHSDMGYVYTDKGYGTYSWTKLAPSSPMLYDIHAIQHLYGMNIETRTGDDFYTFSADTPFIETIWDAGGTDTLNASNQKYAATLNLNEGAFSSVGVRYMEYRKPSAAVDNLVIAFGTQVENAIGTKFDDIFIGNHLDNVFTGNGGSDKVDGGGGKNTFVLAGNYADYSVSGSISAAQVIDGNDTVMLTGIEYVQFADQVHTFT